MNLLDTLGDIEIAASLMKDNSKTDDSTYQNYEKLKAEIHVTRYLKMINISQPLEKDTKEYKLLETYAYDSHDSNYFSQFSFSVEDIFAITREGEDVVI
jgi:hypothetical protein